MSLNFVSTTSSSVNQKGFPLFPKLKTNEKKVVTFLHQIKDFDPTHPDADAPAMVDSKFYYDKISNSYFKFADDVNPKIKSLVTSRSTTVEKITSITNLLVYTLDSKGAINGVEGVYIAQLSRDKLNSLNEVLESLKFENPKASLYNFDFQIKCDDEKFQKWIINSRGTTKSFTTLDESAKKEWLDVGLKYITEMYPKLQRSFDDTQLIEKFDLDSSLLNSSASVNNMASASNEFSHLVQNNNPFNDND